MTQIGSISRNTLHDAITERIRDMIIEGELVQGERIYEGPLCEQLGVSRTPLREALRFLASEGLVELTPNRGASVRRFSAQDIEDMLVVIRAMEELAGKIACEKASDAEIAEVRALHEEMLGYYRNQDRLAYYKANQSIHSSIVRLSHNATLVHAHAGLQSRLKRIRFIGHSGADKWAAAVEEHERMITALEARDADGLIQALGSHLTNAWLRVQDKIQDEA
ncbi:GntR family transcriptional regulator [Halotalea alkalilenta]|uniref:GntR family transcriptional regulator n=1 Tax=Halotalea alkalilenta TaxID=376489 RepID=UPI0004880D01|nr:GntR family transcriptional regulator [Halotalea alkalilenta]